MRRLQVRVIQLMILAALTFGFALPPAPAEGSEFGCYLICLALDWDCILRTGHPAEQCGYDAESDICTPGGCWLQN